MKQQLHLEQGTQEWLDARTQYRTASEAAIVLDISPWTSPADFKLIKAGLKQQYYSKAMQQGHELEDTVRQLANAHFGLTFTDQCWVNGNYMASLDGIDGETLVELKVSDRTYEDLKNGITPEYYEVQVQQQLYCSPAEVGYIVAYSPKAGDIMISVPIYPRRDFLPTLEKAWTAFDAMPIPEGPIEANGDGEVLKLFHHFAYLKNQAEQLKEQMDAIRKELIEKSSSKGFKAGGYTLRQSKPRTSYDYKTACADAKLDLEPYKKVAEGSWGITVPKNPFEDEE